MNEASENCDSDGNTSDCSGSWISVARCVKHSGSKADTVACHVSKSHETESEHTRTQEYGASSVCGLLVDILEVIEVTAAARYTLFNAIDGVTGNIETVLYVDVDA